MKGYLRSQDGLFQLAPKVTTIGREGCDLVIQSVGVDYQHAVLEYSNDEHCFVLQDLNTAQGTFVNECRVQNAAVRLAHGDVIRFGNSGATYELAIDSTDQVACPPVNQRAAWAPPQPLTILHEREFHPPTPASLDALPHLQNIRPAPAPAWGPQNPNQLPVPRPPASTGTTLRTRPLSAGNVGTRRSVTIANGQQSPPQHRAISGAGWVQVGVPASSLARVNVTTTTAQNTQGADFVAIQEKEQRILRLTDELQRLRTYENECGRKEEMIQTLREEIADLQGRQRQMETSRGVIELSGENDLVQKVMQLESEVQLKRTEISSLKEQISRMKTTSVEVSVQGQNGMSRQEMNDRIAELNSLRSEMERVRKDKNLLSNLVSDMQRDMANKDTTVSRLSREIESLKKEIGEKDTQLLSMQTKFKRMEECRKTNEEMEVKDKELAAMRLKFRTTENRLQEQTDLISSLKEEVEKVRKTALEDKGRFSQVQKDLDLAKSRTVDFERAERAVRVDLEQVSKKLERFRSRIIQTTFSTPGIKAPDTEINDDDLVKTLKKLIDERTDLKRQTQDLKQEVNQANMTKKEVNDSTKKLKQQMNETISKLLSDGFRASCLRQHTDLLRTMAVNPSMSWMQEELIRLFSGQFGWQHEIEMALEECGINVKISDERPAAHILSLKEKMKELNTQIQTLTEQLNTAEQRHKIDVELAIANIRQEVSNQTTDEVERVKLESEERLNRMIDEIRSLEAEKRENQLQMEREKYTSMEENLQTLKLSIEEKEGETKEELKTALLQIDVLKAREEEYKLQISTLEQGQSEEMAKLKKLVGESEVKVEMSVTGYKEQVHQHSVTICTLEERLNKLVKKNKDYQSEITHLKHTITELHKKPKTSPKHTKVLVEKTNNDILTLEKTITELRKENMTLKTQVNEQQSVITGLRRDLTGATARLTDVTGELSETQKEELERYRLAVKSKEQELVDLRQKMCVLSEIVDRQKVELKDYNSELSKQKTTLSKFKTVHTDKDGKIKELEDMLMKEQSASKKKIELLQEDGRITSELTSLGAQCRGERHEQVITRQREALTELRSRIKALEQTRPQAPSHDQALQQVILLKKELSEMKANQAMSSGDSGFVETLTLKNQVSKARGQPSPQDTASAEMERSAHRETIEALELSENSYITLLRNSSAALELDTVAGLRTMAHIPRDERGRLAIEREHICEVISSRIKVLKERIERKDELLQGYEKDLAKLRQAEKLAEQRDTQVTSLSSDVRSRAEEAQYLRESLHRTRDHLEQERRLNSAIKQRKTFHLENERASDRPLSAKKPHCEFEDVLGKSAAKKKATTEKMRRKNYELRVLKGELATKDRSLSDTRRRLMALESNIGLETPRNLQIVEAP